MSDEKCPKCGAGGRIQAAQLFGQTSWDEFGTFDCNSRGLRASGQKHFEEFRRTNDCRDRQIATLEARIEELEAALAAKEEK